MSGPLGQTLMLAPSTRVVLATFAASVNDIVLSDWLTANAPWNGLEAKDFIVTINAGVTIGSTALGIPALTIDDLPTGSTLKIVNKGRIQGKGGNGGQGGNAGGGSGQAAQAGGDAISLERSTVTIDNAAGDIWGGGGGGGGGGSHVNGFDAGSGGGGGAGTNVGAGNGPGSGGGAGTGASGTATAGGNGASQGVNGGNGGDPGEAGTSGASNGGGGGGAGGAAGKAIDLNGNSVTWISGSTAPNVLGAVS